jgi:hypothetical protein
MRKFLKIFGYFILILTALAFASIEKIDRTAIEKTEHFKHFLDYVKKEGYYEQ